MQIQKFALASLLAACGGEISTLWQLLTVVTTPFETADSEFATSGFQ